MGRAGAGAGLDVLTAHPRVDGRAAAVGYCFGGTTVLELARAGAAVAGVASVHGGLRRRRPGPVTPIAARVLACHGGADPHVPPADVAAFVDEMAAAAADWQLAVYRDAAHGFTHRQPSVTPGVAYDARRHPLGERAVGCSSPSCSSATSPATPARTAAARRWAR